MSKQTIVLGAGIVGVSVAWHLKQRGHHVLLIDKNQPGQETSFGNAGIIQREAVEPYAFPQDMKTLLRVLPNRSIDIRYRPLSVLESSQPLLNYYLNSFPKRYTQIARDYASLIGLSTQEHERLIAASNTHNLVQKQGWLEIYRSEKAFASARTKALKFKPLGVEFNVLTNAEIHALQPGFNQPLAGGIHWLNSWTVESPSDLVKGYADAFLADGGEYVQAEVFDIIKDTHGYRLNTSKGTHEAEQAIICLGPWSKGLLKPLQYNIPLFAKRGYHMHYQQPEQDKSLRYWFMDAEKGYLLEPMKSGIRLTTGAELASLDDPPAYGQLDVAEKTARKLFNFGERVDTTPWRGSRPCLPDMKPIIGPAHKPEHRGLWFALGHGHQGFTLGPATGRLLAEMFDGEPTAIDMTPFRSDRFGQ